METISEAEESLVAKAPVGAIFRHYKGQDYKVLHIARHSDDEKLYVVYQGLYFSEEFGNFPIWIRPLEIFVEKFTLTHPPSHE